jgi:elongator complex protein 2
MVETPPFEDQLMQSTLWPELNKLYGHGNEVFCICASNDGELIATACKGTDTVQSAIRVWNTKTWKQVALLSGHNLTVTQLAFSHNDRYLLRYKLKQSLSLSLSVCVCV